jgi:predicted lipoprotein with Yx(FWY)xxD motif
MRGDMRGACCGCPPLPKDPRRFVADDHRLTGVNGLATIRRPDGHVQVTYRGGPVYTFYLDRKRGDIGGEGFKDVGVLHAATIVKTSSQTERSSRPSV